MNPSIEYAAVGPPTRTTAWPKVATLELSPFARMTFACPPPPPEGFGFVIVASHPVPLNVREA